MKTIERLRTYKPSEGPWRYEPLYWALRMAEKGGDNHVPEDLPEGSRYPCRDDAAYIADVCNALPALLAVVEAQAAEIEAWRDADLALDLVQVIANSTDHLGQYGVIDAREKTDAAIRAMEGVG